MPPKKVIILNGWTKGDISDIPEFLPDSPANWLGWTKSELEKQGYAVTNPFLKDGYKQEYKEWKEEIEKLDIDENTTLVGWSAGGAFWVRWLGETKRRVGKLILVAPAKIYDDARNKGSMMGEGSRREMNAESNFDRFMDFEIDQTIKERVGEIVIFISNDTRYLVESANLYAEKLHARLVEIANQGHFTNTERISSEFPELLEAIMR